MFSQLRMREEQALLAQDYALEQAEEKGVERGKAEGREAFCISGYDTPTCFNFRICE